MTAATAKDERRGAGVRKLRTQIEGFDLIACGGLPRGRSTLLSSTSGSAKTVFAAQFVAAGIVKAGESGVFLTFEEPADDIRRNMSGFGWDIARWEADGKWAFVDASPRPGEEPVVTGDYDLGALLARAENAARKTGATRVVVDSIGAAFLQSPDARTVRRELFRLTAALKALGVTALITAERADDHGPVCREGVEEFVSDNVVILRNSLEQEKRRRTIEILKFRGTRHRRADAAPLARHGGLAR